MQQMPVTGVDVEGLLAANKFIPCGPTSAVSHGWVAPRAKEGALCEIINGQMILKLTTETKTVPVEMLDRKLDERCQAIRMETGRDVGKKQRRGLKEELLLELLPGAFPKRTSTLVWINPAKKTVLIGAASGKRADEVALILAQSIQAAGDVFAMSPINTKLQPKLWMSTFLLDARSETMELGTSCVIKAVDESKRKVAYKNHALDIDEIKDHLKQGMLVQSLSLNYLNRVEFTFCDDGSLKNIEVIEFPDADADVDAFDSDVSVFTTEMSSLIDDLIEELGGEVQPTKEPS